MKRFIFMAWLCLMCSASYADVATGLVHWWKFDEASGTSALDSSGSANTGTLMNSPPRVAGKIGPYALSFLTASSRYVVDTAAVNLPALNGAQTLSAWVYLSGSGIRDIITVANATPNAGNQFRINAAGNAEVSRWGGGITITAGAVSAGTWHLVVWTYTGATNTIYIDGAASGATTATSPATGVAARVIVGSYGSGEYFSGYIDDVRIYNRALTAADVRHLYSYSGKTGFFVLTNEN